MAMANFKLTDEQKAFIDANYQETPDIQELTRQAFMNDSLDGRTKEGRAVRKYMSEKQYAYQTTKRPAAKKIKLTEQQKEFILENAAGMKAFEIAVVLFPDKRNITPLSKESLEVAKYISDNQPEMVHPKDTGLNKEYEVPTEMEDIIAKVNEFAGQKFKKEKLSVGVRKGLEMLMIFLQSPRLKQVVENYTDINDRKLFEAEFIRATWDKSDLTSDEVNLYINVCIDYINLKNIQKAMDKLNHMFDSCEDQREMTVRLAELLKTKSEEYNQCEKRMESLVTRLNGDRAKRVQNKHQQNASILNLVQIFQEEEERSVMVKIAEMQKQLVSEEAENLESMPDWKARVLGLRKEDLI